MGVTFFTCVNDNYSDFIPIYIHSILFHNKDVDIEIGVDNINPHIMECVDFLKEKYKGSKINIRKVEFNISPNTVRFIETPEIVNDYVYITDIDIVTLQKSLSVLHLSDMEITGLNYSNIVRPYNDIKNRKLSGLHFTKWDSYYPIPDYTDLMELLNNDETFLYELVSKKNEVSETSTYRPVHGIHMSPNRKNPEATLGWGLGMWEKEWTNYRNSDEFKFIEKKYLSKRILNNIDLVDKFYNIKMREMESIFTATYDNNLWNGSESKSGPGSNLNNNLKLLKILEEFVIDNNIKTILDLGCGDFNWMKHFNFDLIDSYLGIDIVNNIIDHNCNTYGTDKIKFEHRNIVDYELSSFDLILSKDVLVHLSYNDSLSILTNIKQSNSKFFISTSFDGFINYDIITGQWRPINLVLDPFNFSEPLYYYPNVEDKKEGWTNKGVGIWKLI